MTCIHPLLDKEKQRQARQYEKENRIIGLGGMILSLGTVLAFHFSGLSLWLSRLFLGHSIIWAFLIYAVVFHTVLFVFGFPLSFYSGYWHEHRWNFSNQSGKSWLWEQVKSFLVGSLVFSILFCLLLGIMTLYPHNWWWIAGLASALVSVIFATLFPVVILPLFNTYTPIAKPELTDSLQRILKEGGLRSSGFFVMDMSRQTKKENAFLAGLGRTRRVVLSDNLLERMSAPEIESIIAHEVGHFKHKHIWKQVGVGTLHQVLVFFCVHILLRNLFPAFLSSARENLLLFPLFIIFMGGISTFLFSPVSHGLSRSFERQADRYALSSTANPRAFLTALAGLADRNLSNAYPEWWIRLLFYSHPPIGERLRFAEKHQ